jgi:hypothetical protein
LRIQLVLLYSITIRYYRSHRKSELVFPYHTLCYIADSCYTAYCCWAFRLLGTLANAIKAGQKCTWKWISREYHQRINASKARQFLLLKKYIRRHICIIEVEMRLSSLFMDLRLSTNIQQPHYLLLFFNRCVLTALFMWCNYWTNENTWEGLALEGQNKHGFIQTVYDFLFLYLILCSLEILGWLFANEINIARLLGQHLHILKL